MIGFLVLLILLVPFIELWVIIEVWQAIGGLSTLGLLLLVSVVGAWLVKREGVGVWQRLNDQIDAGRIPGTEVFDGAFILFAGALLLTPGFVTDAVGIVLLLPPTRAGLRRLVTHRLARRVGGPLRVFSWAGRAAGGRPAAGFDDHRDRGHADGFVDVTGTESRPSAASHGTASHGAASPGAASPGSSGRAPTHELGR